MDNGTLASSDNGMLTVLIAVIAGAFLFLVFFINFYIPFKEERDYIKMEIARALDEKEYLYWKKQLKKLYLSYIPFIGRFFS